MTDLEKFIELYKSLGIRCKVNEFDDMKIIYLGDKTMRNNKIKLTSHRSLMGGNFSAYCGIVFDKNGKFIEQNFYKG